MKIINSASKLGAYISKYRINEYFEDFELLTPMLYSYDQGDYIFMSGDEVSMFKYIVSGRIKIYAGLPNGKTCLITIHDAPAFLGDIEFILKQVSPHSVVALTEVMCIHIPYAGHEDILKKDLVLYRRLAAQLARSLISNSNELSATLGYNLKTRLALYLVNAFPDGRIWQSLDEMADQLNTSYRNLLRMLAEFEKSGLILNSSKGIYEISDVSGLQRLAQCNK